jgi:hypothetical protein
MNKLYKTPHHRYGKDVLCNIDKHLVTLENLLVNDIPVLYLQVTDTARLLVTK